MWSFAGSCEHCRDNENCRNFVWYRECPFSFLIWGNNKGTVKSLYTRQDHALGASFINTHKLLSQSDAEVGITDCSKIQLEVSLPADVLWGSFVSHSFLPHGQMSAVFSRRPWGRNECVTNEPQRTSVRRLTRGLLSMLHSDWLSYY